MLFYFQSITTVSFGGAGGWMSWTPVDIGRSQIIVFQFRTEQPEGVILYTANNGGVRIIK